jgi:hypothetical protein
MIPSRGFRSLPTAYRQSECRLGAWRWYLSAAHFVGFDVGIVDEIAGDVIEGRAGLATSPAIVTFVWCAGQAVRAIPYLAMDTLRRGPRQARLRLVAAVSALALAAAAVVTAVQLHIGPPARIEADRGFDTNDIVINNVKAMQMPIRALDARGHAVPNAGIRYERLDGDDIVVSQNGAISCRDRGDAVIRASLNDISSRITVHCRPVTQIRTQGWHDFLPGDGPHVVRVAVLDGDGKPVKELRGSVRVADTSIATLHRGFLTPHKTGTSRLTITIGNARTTVTIAVHEMVSRFDNLAPTQRSVAMRLRLAPGDTLHLPAPVGTVWVKWLSRDGSARHPELTAEGSGYCHNFNDALSEFPRDEYGAYCELADGARIRVARPGKTGPALTGALLVDVLSR